MLLLNVGIIVNWSLLSWLNLWTFFNDLVIRLRIFLLSKNNIFIINKLLLLWFLNRLLWINLWIKIRFEFKLSWINRSSLVIHILNFFFLRIFFINFHRNVFNCFGRFIFLFFILLILIYAYVYYFVKILWVLFYPFRIKNGIFIHIFIDKICSFLLIEC